MPIANLEGAVGNSTVKGAPSTNFSAPVIAQSVINDFLIVINQLRVLAGIAGQNNVEHAVAMLSEPIGFYEK